MLVCVWYGTSVFKRERAVCTTQSDRIMCGDARPCFMRISSLARQRTPAHLALSWIWYVSPFGATPPRLTDRLTSEPFTALSNGCCLCTAPFDERIASNLLAKRAPALRITEHQNVAAVDAAASSMTTTRRDALCCVGEWRAGGSGFRIPSCYRRWEI